MSTITLKKLKNTDFFNLYSKLLLSQQLNEHEKEAILKISLILINAGDEYSMELGYRVIVIYSNYTSNYKPLYDTAISKGYYPISKSIEGNEELTGKFENTFYSTLLSSLGETYQENGIYLTSQQTELSRYFEENVDKGIAIVAPTSYGKSELFINFCNSHEKATIAIIVPTKALLAQMKRRIIQGIEGSDKKRKIITHPEMYNQDDIGFVGILTQERLLRIIQNNRTLEFDYVFIDEAHNLLSGDQRNLLLAKVIALISARCNKTSFSYLTPFLIETKNLEIKYTKSNFSEFRIKEHLKTERFHVIDLCEEGDHILKLYDQYFDKFISITNTLSINEMQFLKTYSGEKNIVYLNSPPKLEKFAMNITSSSDLIENYELKAACKAISEFLHEDYGLLDCLRRGVIYHHGSVPDVLKLYIENLYTTIPDIKYIVSSSTLLEGVNIPAEKLFLFEYKKGPRNLTASQFKNLVGRICRFNEIFSPVDGTLSMLEPEIYIVATSLMPATANIESYIQKTVKIDKKINDKLENILLEETPTSDTNKEKIEKANEILENLEPGITGGDSEYAKTVFGEHCYANNIFEFDILACEEEISFLLNEIADPESKINNTEELMDVIHIAFIDYIPIETHRHLQRLAQESAKRFYKMLIDWRIRNASYSEMIGRFLAYWNEKEDPLVYVDKWGETPREGSFFNRWVDIRKKTYKQKVNLAIVRIKEEQDFLDNQIMKFVEALNDMELLDNEYYTKVKYGTTNERKITMMKNGYSSGITKLLLEKYSEYLQIDTQANTVGLMKEIEKAMIENEENRIYIYEASFYISE